VLLAQACGQFVALLPLFAQVRAAVLAALQGGDAGPLPALTALSGGVADVIVPDFVLFLGACWRARQLGDVAAGMGDAPIVHPRRLVWICAGAAGYAAALGGVAGVAARHGSAVAATLGDYLGQTADASLSARLLAAVHIVVLAPLVEEMFFRGWLWQGLRLTRGTAAAGWLTAALSLGYEGLDGGWPLLLALLPPTALITASRALCGSIRASALTHLAGNAALLAAYRLAA
jgi:membrane protease YdiL (CAAX protease family)